MAADLGDLTAFVAVARTGGRRGAARQCFSGPFLYDRSIRHMPGPLRAFVDFVKDEPSRSRIRAASP